MSGEVTIGGRHGGRVEVRDGRRVFVKPARDDAARRELAREALVLGLLSREPELAALVAPAVREDDEGLLLEEVHGRDLRPRNTTDPPLAPAVAAAVGVALATLHRAGIAIADDMPDAIPSDVFGIPRPDPAFLRRRSGAELDLLPLLQRSGSLCSHIDRLAADRGRDTVVHNDLRLENVMREGAPPSGIRLVDWEFAGRGDWREDVGAFAGALLDTWLSSIPSVPGVPPDGLVAHAAVPIETVAPSIESFLDAYSSARGMEGVAPTELRLAAIEFAALRAVHLTFEAAALAEGMRLDHVLRLQVAENILDDPSAGLRWLLLDHPRVHVA